MHPIPREPFAPKAAIEGVTKASGPFARDVGPRRGDVSRGCMGHPPGTDPLARWVALVPTLDEEARIGPLVERLLGSGHATVRPGPDGDLVDPIPDRVDAVVVADGGSSDRTVEFARGAGAGVVLGPPGRGTQLLSAGRAPEARTAEVLLVIHADCTPASGAIAALRRAYRDPLLHWGAMEQRILARGWIYRWIERASAGRVRRGHRVFGDCGLSLRRSLYDRVGGFAAIPLFEDVELSGRLALLGAPQLIPGAALEVSARRWQGEGALRCTLRNWMLRTAFRFGASPERLSRFYAVEDPSQDPRPAPPADPNPKGTP